MFFNSGLFVRVTIQPSGGIPSLRSQSWDIAQYPELAKQSNSAILGGSRVAYTKFVYCIWP